VKSRKLHSELVNESLDPTLLVKPECKRKKKDSITLPQREWLSDALKVGFTLENFLIFEWTAEEVQSSSLD
jgi:hypothetical protein